MLFLLLSTLLPSVAEAKGPYMWGAGPTVNTIVLPGFHPVGVPKAVKVENKDGKLENPLDETKGDIGIGVRGVMYMKRAQRVGAHAWYSMGKGDYRSPNLVVTYDFAGEASNGVTVLAGLGGGFGKQKWDTSGVGELSMATYILRARGAVNYRTKTNCYEFGAFLNLNIPGVQTWEADGEDAETVRGGFYPTVGIEGTVFFGDFRPPKKGGGKRGKKKGGRR